MKKVSFKEKVKDILVWTMNILLSLIGIALLAVITALVGKLVNYSPWSLLVVDILFIFAINKFINKFYYSVKRKNNFWVYFVIISVVLGLIISTGISLVHSWAILNIIILIFLFFFSLVLFAKRRAKNNLI